MRAIFVSTSAYTRPPVQTVRVQVGRKETLGGRKDYLSFDQCLRLTSFLESHLYRVCLFIVNEMLSLSGV